MDTVELGEKKLESFSIYSNKNRRLAPAAVAGVHVRDVMFVESMFTRDVTFLGLMKSTLSWFGNLVYKSVIASLVNCFLLPLKEILCCFILLPLLAL